MNQPVNSVPRVVHCKRERYDVLIDRSTKWGNQFSHLPKSTAEFKVDTREEAVAKHRAWVLTQPELVAQIRAELRGSTLGCWCAPKSCHGDTLLEIANQP